MVLMELHVYNNLHVNILLFVWNSKNNNNDRSERNEPCGVVD